MTYVYDLVLNFNSEPFEFYEWMKGDMLYDIKRINLVKTDSKSYNEIMDNNVLFDDEFLLSIFNKCEYFENRGVKEIPYAFLITDTMRVMGIMLDMHGSIIKYSSLLLDEEEDVLDISDRLGVIKLKYEIKTKKHHVNDLTRYENNVLWYIKKDLNVCYKEKNLSKLKYLYYEYFNKQCNDLDTIYNSFLKELDSVNEKHYNLYNLIKLSYTHKNV